MNLLVQDMVEFAEYLILLGDSSGGLSSLSPSSRESVDPIAELLSQLSGVRRSAAGQGSTPSQLQQLQMQLQLERQQIVGYLKN
ncbi:E3 ubiquitin-protein ligase KCMF1 [Gryllus bimaculatus]|nr:E3 ubiquitin-protein ligase KCMF1 [Gryllus bimaculatus]